MMKCTLLLFLLVGATFAAKCNMKSDVEKHLRVLEDENAKELQKAKIIVETAQVSVQNLVNELSEAEKTLAAAKSEKMKRSHELAACVGQANALKNELNTVSNTVFREIQMIKKLEDAVSSFKSSHGKHGLKGKLNLNKSKLRPKTSTMLEIGLAGNYEDAEKILEVLEALQKRLAKEVSDLTNEWNKKKSECAQRTGVYQTAITMAKGAEAARDDVINRKDEAEKILVKAQMAFKHTSTVIKNQDANMKKARKVMDKLPCHNKELSGQNVCMAFSLVDKVVEDKTNELKNLRLVYNNKKAHSIQMDSLHQQKSAVVKAVKAHLNKVIDDERICFDEKKDEEKELQKLKEHTTNMLNLIDLLYKRADCVRAVQKGGAMPAGCANLQENLQSDETDKSELLQMVRDHSEVKVVYDLLHKIKASLTRELQYFQDKVSRITCDHRTKSRKAVQKALQLATAALHIALSNKINAHASYTQSKHTLNNVQAAYTASYDDLKALRSELISVTKRNEGKTVYQKTCNISPPPLQKHHKVNKNLAAEIEE